MPFTKEQILEECNGSSQMAYLPTLQDIDRECSEIQKGWSRCERRSRSIAEHEPYTIPQLCQDRHRKESTVDK
jgi:hypothetical protein